MRLTPLDRDNLPEAQQRVLEMIESGPRGANRPGIGSIGPFPSFVKAPGIGAAAQALGAAVRFEGILPENIKEIAICMVGIYYRAKFEYSAHRAMAIRAGVSETCLDQILEGEEPAFAGDELVAYTIASQLLHQHQVIDETYAAGLDAFGEQGMIELVFTIGYYCLICHTLNTFQVPLADGMADPFPND